LLDFSFVELGVKGIHKSFQNDVQFQQPAPAPPADALQFLHAVFHMPSKNLKFEASLSGNREREQKTLTQHMLNM
jgi:hypothetical protein